MKTMKRIAGMLLAVAMLLIMAVPALALEEVAADTGSIFIKNNETIDASQKIFSAYKILDLKAYKNAQGEIVNYDYSVPAKLAQFYADRYSLDKTATDFPMKVVANIREEADLYAFSNAVLEAVKENDVYGISGKAVAGQGYKFTGMPLGYYVIADETAQGDFIKPVSSMILDTVTPDVEVEVKAEKPPVEKEIDVDHDYTTDADRTDTNQVAIGDEVSYIITSKVPDMTGYNKYFFVVKDTMSKGLTYNDNMEVKIGNKVLAKDVDYVITKVVKEDGTTELKVVFTNFIQYNTAEFIDQPITLTYTATLNEDAEVNKTPNTNEVYLEYSDNPKVNYDGVNEPTEEDLQKEPIGVTPKDETETFTTSIEIIKTDPLGNRLEGAEFTLTGEAMNIVRLERDVFTQNADGNYWKLLDGSYTPTDPESLINGAPVDKTKYDSLTTKYVKETIVEDIVTTETKEVQGTVSTDGTLRFEGLAAGNFTITEVKAPAGYNPLTEDLNVVITWDPVTKEFGYQGASDVNGVATVTVLNQAGTELPSTGGTGTTLFYVIGGVLVLAAVVVLVSRKRMSQGA